MTAPKSRPPLAVGERVRVYGASLREDTKRMDPGVMNGHPARILAVQERTDGPGENILVVLDGIEGSILDRKDVRCWVHSRQLRRLVKRKRREWWLIECCDRMIAYECSQRGYEDEQIHVREVPRGKSS